ncbi:I78 family peptidase inhibitor [Pararhodobacter oceanensis]|uniref:Peptidase inhibitor I78 n=1 Tax=Pararhodobacter oceanensis TaxID=2172121 RepID=A0A2T8HST7_9RHOB|nr:I78 family peptidase inhibitor [Pararhodobacter oceanensis]PVH28485.1 hypothetical protein DDE20_13015 [Pararhodobacter oceanensis]
MRVILGMAVLALIAGCTTELPQERADNADPVDACGAAQLQHLVGAPLPQPFSHQGDVRIYTSGSPVTMDNRPDRLNIELAPSGGQQVVAVSCG